jgi:predicted nucleic acid-binding protein
MALRATLDTRFFFAYFNPATPKQSEWCKSIVREAGRDGSLLVVSAVSVAELYEHMGRRIGEDAVTIRVASMKAKGIWLADVDESIASEAGRIMLSQADVPLADAIVAATAKAFAPLIYTDDPHFKQLKGITVQWKE